MFHLYRRILFIAAQPSSGVYGIPVSNGIVLRNKVMGNSSLKGGLYVTVESLVVFPGDTLVGTININLKERLVNATLQFHFYGEEKTRWSTGSGKNRRTHRGRSVCCNFINTACAWPVLEPGDLIIPFRFTLPAILPATFKFDRGAHGSIKYNFKATLTNDKNHNAKHEVEIIIKPAINFPDTFQNLYPSTKKAKLVSCGCFGKGTCTITGSLNKHVFVANEQVFVQAIVDNTHGTVDVQQVSAKLNRYIRLRSNGNREYTSNRTITTQTAHGIGAGTGATTINLVIDFNRVSDSFLNLYSTLGNVIECIYTIEIRAVMDASCLCCGSYPMVEVPIVVTAANYALQTLPPPPIPEGWNPQSMNEMEMVYTSHFDYASAPPLEEPNEI